MPPAICCFTLLPYINISRLLRCQIPFFSYSCPRNAKAHQHSAQWRSAHRVHEGKAKLVAFYVLCMCMCVCVCTRCKTIAQDKLQEQDTTNEIFPFG